MMCKSRPSRDSAEQNFLTKKEYLLRLLPFGESNIYNKELSKIHICRKDVLSNGEIFYFCNEASCGIGESMLEKILVKENNLEIEQEKKL